MVFPREDMMNSTVWKFHSGAPSDVVSADPRYYETVSSKGDMLIVYVTMPGKCLNHNKNNNKKQILYYRINYINKN